MKSTKGNRIDMNPQFRQISKLCLVIFASASVGCNSNSANSSNFQAALDHNFEHHRECLFLLKFPLQGFMSGHEDGFNALTAVGLLSRTPDPKWRGSFIYDRTPAGREASDEPNQNGFIWFGCFATRKVVEITNFTEPSAGPFGGPMTAMVQFTWKYTKIAPWIDDPAVQATLWNFLTEFKANRNKASISGSDSLVLTHKGWREGNDQ